jgi:hypothetical protein
MNNQNNNYSNAEEPRYVPPTMKTEVHKGTLIAYKPINIEDYADCSAFIVENCEQENPSIHPLRGDKTIKLLHAEDEHKDFCVVKVIGNMNGNNTGVIPYDIDIYQSTHQIVNMKIGEEVEFFVSKGKAIVLNHREN